MLDDHKHHIHEIVVAFLISEPTHWIGISCVVAGYFLLMLGISLLGNFINIGAVE